MIKDDYAERCSDTWGERASPHADSTSRWGTPWWAGHLSAERCEWCRQWPESALQPLWACEWRWRPPPSLVVPPPVIWQTYIDGWAGRCSIHFFPSFCHLFAHLTSLISVAVLKGGFSCSSCSLSNWTSRWGRRGEPARAWQKMAFTGEDLNLQV